MMFSITEATPADADVVVGLVRELARESGGTSDVDAADGCLIEDLYVRPAWRGKGVGRSLVAHVMAEAPRRGWAEVSVSTGKDNAAALSLYRGQGLVEEYVLLEKHFLGA